MASQEHVGWERVRFIAKSLPLLKSQEFERLVFLVNINSLAGQHFFFGGELRSIQPLIDDKDEPISRSGCEKIRYSLRKQRYCFK